jgi:hypothetical protein
MWLCTAEAFLSVVADRESPTHLLVRGRVAGHIESVFPDAKVTISETADYRYRARLPRKAVAAVFSKMVRDITYDNFKNSVTSSSLHLAYTAIWRMMRNLQSRDNSRCIKLNQIC